VSSSQADFSTSDFNSLNERMRLMRDTVMNNLSMVVSTLVGFLLVPLMLKSLGSDLYGLWIIAISMMGIVSTIDFGLSWSIIRIIATNPKTHTDDDVSFIGSTANVYALIGLLGCLLFSFVGWLSTDNLHLTHCKPAAIFLVFFLFGVQFFFEKIGGFSAAVLTGLRRFKELNSIAILGSIVWMTGAMLILAFSGNVIFIVLCQLVVAVAKCLAFLLFAGRLSPMGRFRPFYFKWESFQRHISFTLSSFLASLFSSVAWNTAPMLLGLLKGPAIAVPFYIGQKFPLAVSSILWRTTEVLFPAASESRQDTTKSGELLRMGSRWIFILLLPFIIFFLVSAPDILRAWIGNPSQEAISILRILTGAVLMDALLAMPLYLLWGHGIMRPILFISAFQAIGTIILTTVLIYPFGVLGAGWSLLIPTAIAAVYLIAIATNECRVRAGSFLTNLLHGLMLPALTCVLCASTLLAFLPKNRYSVLLAATISMILYVLILFKYSGSKEEKSLMHELYFLLRKEKRGE